MLFSSSQNSLRLTERDREIEINNNKKKKDVSAQCLRRLVDELPSCLVTPVFACLSRPKKEKENVTTLLFLWLFECFSSTKRHNEIEREEKYLRISVDMHRPSRELLLYVSIYLSISIYLLISLSMCTLSTHIDVYY